MKNTLYLCAVALVALTGCENQIARNFGGEIEQTLPANAQLVNATWKRNALWYLYYVPETNTCFFKESSAFGVFEGAVVFPNCNYKNEAN